MTCRHDRQEGHGSRSVRGRAAQECLARSSGTTRVVSTAPPISRKALKAAGGTRPYVTNLFTDGVFVINPATNAYVDALRLPGSGALGMAVSSDGTRIYVGQLFRRYGDGARWYRALAEPLTCRSDHSYY